MQIPASLASSVIGDIRAKDRILRRARQRRPADAGPRVALVVQGGGLRAIVSCGAADALDVLGLRDAFDVVYGGSSGAVNAAYFLAGQAALGVTVYSEDVNNSRFFAFRRLSRALDLKFFVNEIVRGRKPLDRQALARQDSDLRIALTDYYTGELEWFSDFRQGDSLYEAFEATCAIPGAYPQPVMVAGHAFTDGMINEPIPLMTALKQDYAAILVLLTRPVDHHEQDGLCRRGSIWAFMRRHASPALYPRLQNLWQRVNEGMEAVARTPYVLGVTCDRPLIPGRFEKRADRLLAAAYSAWRNTLMLFGYEGDMSRAAFDRRLTSAKNRVASSHT